MKDEIKRVFEKMEEMKWITIADSLDRDALARVFVEDVFKGMTVKKFIETFYPSDL